MSWYHKAAIDGNCHILKEATRKDLNTADEDGMTPTILAAFYGHVDALQLICSRDGDPNRSDIWGNTPLHHAAGNGHMHILSFLVSFGVNLFALDNEFHTAMEVAASHDHMDCVRLLDSAASKQTSRNPKKVDNQKKEAKKEAEKRVKLCEKVKKKHQSNMDKMQRGSVSEASIVPTFTSGSTNEEILDGEEPDQINLSILNRPVGIPSRNSESLGILGQNEADEDDSVFEGTGDTDLPWDQEGLGLDDDEDEETSPLDVFLSALDLPELTPSFSREHLDLEALMLCSDEDLKGIRIQLGQRKKLLEAITRRKSALESPGLMKDSSL